MTDSDLRTRSKNLWNEGSVRRVRVFKEGKDLINLPLHVTVILALVVPWLVIGGILVALLFGYSAEVTDASDTDAPAPPDEPTIPHDDI